MNVAFLCDGVIVESGKAQGFFQILAIDGALQKVRSITTFLQDISDIRERTAHIDG